MPLRAMRSRFQSFLSHPVAPSHLRTAEVSEQSLLSQGMSYSDIDGNLVNHLQEVGQNMMGKRR